MDGKYDIQLTRGAEEDLEVLWNYISQNQSPKVAERLIDKILARIESLETQPARGAVPKELKMLGATDYRQVLVAPYRLIYRIIGRSVFISVIADGRRDFQDLLERRLLGPSTLPE